MKGRLLILGAGGHGLVAAEAAKASCKWNDIVFLDDELMQGSEVEGFTVEGQTTALRENCGSEDRFLVAIGDNRLRLRLLESGEKAGCTGAVVVHPAASVSDSAIIGSGSVVLAGAVVNARARIGRAAIINTLSSVDHDCCLGDGVHISPGAHLAGSVQVGDCVWFGVGASAVPSVKIGRGATIGAAAAVISNVLDEETVVGIPAQPLEKGR